MGESKLCSRCRKVKPVSEFHNNRSVPGGIAYDCKACMSARQKASHEKHKEEKNAKRRAKYAKKKQKAEFVEKPASGKCTCQNYRNCFECRNAERRRAHGAGDIPVYRLGMLQAAVGAVQ